MEDKRYVAGSEVSVDANVDHFEWRNSLFERMDPRALKRLDGAQLQPRPTILK